MYMCQWVIYSNDVLRIEYIVVLVLLYLSVTCDCHGDCRTVDVASLEFDHVPEAHSDLPLRMNPKLISKGMIVKSQKVMHRCSCCFGMHRGSMTIV